MGIFNLFTSTSEGVSSSVTGTTNGTQGSPWMTYVVWIAVIAIMIVYFIFSNKKRKKYQEEAQERLNSIAVGDFVKTIGRICGTVQEILPDGTIVLLTGSENYPSYVRIDREAIAEFKKATTEQEEPFGETLSEVKTQNDDAEQEVEVGAEDAEIPTTEEDKPNE